jgi:hypothetical protein
LDPSWDRARGPAPGIDVNLTGAYLGIRAIVPSMRKVEAELLRTPVDRKVYNIVHLICRTKN